jgi:hypothetical protein
METVKPITRRASLPFVLAHALLITFLAVNMVVIASAAS